MEFTIKKIVEGYKKKYFSPVEITNWYLNRIRYINPTINAYITVTEERALQQAERLMEQSNIFETSKISALLGLPISYKDCIDVSDVLTTNGSIIDSKNIANCNAAVVNNLENRGCITLGKNNMYEYATGVSSENNYYGDIKNPINNKKTAGGSSGGSAASVAADMSLASIGTDTSGSIRIPASCCGVVGLKPTYNLVEMNGIFPLSRSLDHAGIIANNLDDAEIILNKLTSNFRGQFANVDISELRIGIPNSYFHEFNDQIIDQMIEKVYKNMEKLGVKFKKIDTTFMKEPVKLSRTIGTSEITVAHSNRHKLFDQKYSDDLLNTFEKGKNIPAFEYLNALQKKEEYTYLVNELFKEVDLIITPTIPINVPDIQRKQNHNEDIGDLLVKYTSPFNLTGHPALSMPSGSLTEGISQGFQIISNNHDEELLLKVAKLYEKHYLN